MNEISDRPQKNGFVFFHVAFVVWFGSKFSWARMVFSLNYWARRYLLFKSWRERKKNDAEKTLTLTKIRKMKTKITQKIQLYHNRTEAQPRFPSRELAPKKNGGIKSTIQLENSFVYHDMTNISRKKWRHIDTASYYWPYYTQIGLMIVIDSESNFNLESLTMKGRAKGMILKGDVVS